MRSSYTFYSFRHDGITDNCKRAALDSTRTGGGPLIWELAVHVFRGEFGADLIAGVSIVSAVLLGQYLAGTLVVLMLSGGEALEAYAVQSASSVLDALARRMPTIAHRKQHATIDDVPLAQVAVGDVVLVFPHEVCPVDGTVVEGHSVMDESYLTGEPYMITKTPGSAVLSGTINGKWHSRFAQIDWWVIRTTQKL